MWPATHTQTWSSLRSCPALARTFAAHPRPETGLYLYILYSSLALVIRHFRLLPPHRHPGRWADGIIGWAFFSLLFERSTYFSYRNHGIMASCKPGLVCVSIHPVSSHCGTVIDTDLCSSLVHNGSPSPRPPLQFQLLPSLPQR